MTRPGDEPTAAVGDADATAAGELHSDAPTTAGARDDETEVVPEVTVPAADLARSYEDGDAGGDYSWRRAAERASFIIIAAAGLSVGASSYSPVSDAQRRAN
jgi:hypothetical protein